MKFDHKIIEQKWQKAWQEQGIYQTKDDSAKPKYYVLDMFPYPSGSGLHVGHPKGYIATDVIARYKMLCGFNVLHPMGWDAFGLPAENYALENKTHPKKAVEQNIATYKRQLELLGFTYDWSREINTTDPQYYRWTQWAFVQMFKAGLVYQSQEPINWCPSCQTGLAAEDLEDGRCERCGTAVEKKLLPQWVIKITAFAERLLNDLEKLTDWPEHIKEMQRAWIGKSVGVTIKFSVIPVSSPVIATRQLAGKQSQEERLPRPFGARNDIIEVFTTRPETIGGATYLALCPEHELITQHATCNTQLIKNYQEVIEYVNKVKNKSELERTDLNKNKTGVELKGLKVINPFTNQEIPIFMVDYVLPDYGTGAIMAVPAHDQRDWEFAKKFNLPIVEVIKKSADYTGDCYTGIGVMQNSDWLNGLSSDRASEKALEWLVKNNFGQASTSYRLRDWVFSRQRYWGEPIPLIYCVDCESKVKSQKSKVGNKGEELNPGWFVDESLPLELPEVESYELSGTGESPLAKIADWVNTTCPKCGGPAKRETNTMPQWAGSCWYYLAYIMRGISPAVIASPEGARQSHTDRFASLAMTDYQETFNQWLPIDCYVGGAEHATRHLIYARFWHKFLFDLAVVSADEPFTKFRQVGLILAADGRKMSKRWRNVINPDEMIENYGADALRVYEMFMGPFDQAIAWNIKGLIGARRFLDKVFKLTQHTPATPERSDGGRSATRNPQHKINNKQLDSLLHQTIKKVGEDVEQFKFNTAISALMILVNKLSEQKTISQEHYKILLLLLSPFAPHLAEELWSSFTPVIARSEATKQSLTLQSIFKQTWPVYDAKLAKQQEIILAVQVNGKLRDTLLIEPSLSEAEVKNLALQSPKIQKWLVDAPVDKIIFVKDKLINFVL